MSARPLRHAASNNTAWIVDRVLAAAVPGLVYFGSARWPSILGAM